MVNYIDLFETWLDIVSREYESIGVRTMAAYGGKRYGISCKDGQLSLRFIMGGEINEQPRSLNDIAEYNPSEISACLNTKKYDCMIVLNPAVLLQYVKQIEYSQLSYSLYNGNKPVFKFTLDREYSLYYVYDDKDTEAAIVTNGSRLLDYLKRTDNLEFICDNFRYKGRMTWELLRGCHASLTNVLEFGNSTPVLSVKNYKYECMGCSEIVEDKAVYHRHRMVAAHIALLYLTGDYDVLGENTYPGVKVIDDTLYVNGQERNMFEFTSTQINRIDEVLGTNEFVVMNYARLKDRLSNGDYLSEPYVIGVKSGMPLILRAVMDCDDNVRFYTVSSESYLESEKNIWCVRKQWIDYTGDLTVKKKNFADTSIIKIVRDARSQEILFDACQAIDEDLFWQLDVLVGNILDN